jgi:hypothetical protein
MRPLIPALLVVALAILVVACAPVEPSPVPSPTASPVQASPNPDLVEFEERLDEASSRLGQLVRSLGAASAGSPRELGLVAAQLGAFAVDELAWLDDHPADACYSDVADEYRAGLTDIAESAAAFAELAAAASPPGDVEGQAAAQSLSAGIAALQQAATLAREARAACR